MVTFVPTPIGNLKDITLRALEVLRAADVVLCEDTRNTLRLLSAYDIRKPLVACHKFNEREAAEKIVAFHRDKKEVAVVSDAGMPVISDPGAVVLRTLRENGVPYTVLPGACAFVCALVLSAFPADRFTFLGFLPEKNTARRELLERFSRARETLVFHCAPHDLDDYVRTLFEAFGNRRACVVREISKIYEESREFFLADGYDGERRGEMVLLVEGAKECAFDVSPAEQVRAYMAEGMEKMEALKRVARERGVPKSELYKLVLKG